jgi:hypothetical protein
MMCHAATSPLPSPAVTNLCVLAIILVGVMGEQEWSNYGITRHPGLGGIQLIPAVEGKPSSHGIVGVHDSMCSAPCVIGESAQAAGQRGSAKEFKIQCKAHQLPSPNHMHSSPCCDFARDIA